MCFGWRVVVEMGQITVQGRNSRSCSTQSQQNHPRQQTHQCRRRCPHRQWQSALQQKRRGKKEGGGKKREEGRERVRKRVTQKANSTHVCLCSSVPIDSTQPTQPTQLTHSLALTLILSLSLSLTHSLTHSLSPTPSSLSPSLVSKAFALTPLTPGAPLETAVKVRLPRTSGSVFSYSTTALAPVTDTTMSWSQSRSMSVACTRYTSARMPVENSWLLNDISPSL